jgi:hypothetical protein
MLPSRIVRHSAAFFSSLFGFFSFFVLFVTAYSIITSQKRYYYKQASCPSLPNDNETHLASFTYYGGLRDRSNKGASLLFESKGSTIYVLLINDVRTTLRRRGPRGAATGNGLDALPRQHK